MRSGATMRAHTQGERATRAQGTLMVHAYGEANACYTRPWYPRPLISPSAFHYLQSAYSQMSEKQ
eukprot:8658605-Pyramimonas_sp.AAC.1